MNNSLFRWILELRVRPTYNLQNSTTGKAFFAFHSPRRMESPWKWFGQQWFALVLQPYDPGLPFVEVVIPSPVTQTYTSVSNYRYHWRKLKKEYWNEGLSDIATIPNKCPRLMHIPRWKHEYESQNDIMSIVVQTTLKLLQKHQQKKTLKLLGKNTTISDSKRESISNDIHNASNVNEWWKIH